MQISGAQALGISIDITELVYKALNGLVRDVDYQDEYACVVEVNVSGYYDGPTENDPGDGYVITSRHTTPDDIEKKIKEVLPGAEVRIHEIETVWED